MTASMLIIDDDTSVLASCQRIFTEEGFTVKTTTSPEEGLEMARQEQPTAILCDWQMPGLNGMKVVEHLEKHAPKSAVVMISGYPTVARATEALKRGAMDYQPKPFTPQEICTTVRKAIADKWDKEKNALGQFEKILEGVTSQLPERG